MAGERVTLWTGAAAAGATFIAVAISAIIIWNTSSKQRAQFHAELAALNTKIEAVGAKIDKTDEAIAEIRKTAALESTAQQIGLLNSKIKKTNEKLAELQQSSPLDGIKATLTQLDVKIEKTGAALAALRKPAQNDDIRAEFDGIKSALAQLATRVDARLETSDKTLADIKAASLRASDTQPAGDTARDKAVARLDTAIGGLKTDISVLKAAIVAQKAGMPSRPRFAPEPDATDTTSSIAAMRPLTIHFGKTGRAHLDAQVAAVVGTLKSAVKNRRNCAILVAGHTDTLGSQDANMDVSKERADAVAARLRTAFDGAAPRIDSVGRGERQLKVQTPDGVANEANRRVEISVDCKG